jgi:hypothetical protein
VPWSGPDGGSWWRRADSGGSDTLGENAVVPASPDDRRVLAFASVLVAIAGIAIAALLFFATGGTQDTPSQHKPLFLGLSPELTKKIETGGPLYFASPFADNGFWLDLEDGQLVALDIVKPGTKDCVAKWKDGRQAYVDCDDNDLHAADLDRFKITVGRLASDSPTDGVYVDLRVRSAAPVQPGGG